MANLQTEKQNLIKALKALRIDPISFAAFLESSIEVASEVNDIAPTLTTERSINEARLVMYLLKG